MKVAELTLTLANISHAGEPVRDSCVAYRSFYLPKMRNIRLILNRTSNDITACKHCVNKDLATCQRFKKKVTFLVINAHLYPIARDPTILFPQTFHSKTEVI